VKVETQMEEDLEHAQSVWPRVIKSALQFRELGKRMFSPSTLAFGNVDGRKLSGSESGVSRAGFATKLGTVQKEASETQYWLECCRVGNCQGSRRNASQEATELLAISVDREKAERMIRDFLLSLYF